MRNYAQYIGRKPSLPSRERGLKLYMNYLCEVGKMSLPSRERGLKWNNYRKNLSQPDVAPFAGAWIEIIRSDSHLKSAVGRSLRGSVD